eukprot:SAG31_NODE_2894_length_4941_cov_45.155340_4_plen_117_part_00
MRLIAGVAIKGLTHHLLGTKEHYAAEKIQSALKKPVDTMTFSFNDDIQRKALRHTYKSLANLRNPPAGSFDDVMKTPEERRMRRYNATQKNFRNLLRGEAQVAGGMTHKIVDKLGR